MRENDHAEGSDGEGIENENVSESGDVAVENALSSRNVVVSDVVSVSVSDDVATDEASVRVSDDGVGSVRVSDERSDVVNGSVDDVVSVDVAVRVSQSDHSVVARLSLIFCRIYERFCPLSMLSHRSSQSWLPQLPDR